MIEISELSITPIGERRWKTNKCWKFKINKIKYKIPKGFIFDFATVPRILWSLFPPATGNYRKPALIHDWMYINSHKTKQFADKIFLQNLKTYNVGFLKRTIMYVGVRIFGNGNYNRGKK